MTQSSSQRKSTLAAAVPVVCEYTALLAMAKCLAAMPHTFAVTMVPCQLVEGLATGIVR